MSERRKEHEDISKKEKVDKKKRVVNEHELNELDKFKEQQVVDDVPLEDLKIEERNNDDKKSSQNTSQSEKKFKGK